MSFGNVVPKSTQCRTAGCGVCMGAVACNVRTQPISIFPSKTRGTIPAKEPADPAGRATSPRPLSHLYCCRLLPWWRQFGQVPGQRKAGTFLLPCKLLKSFPSVLTMALSDVFQC